MKKYTWDEMELEVLNDHMSRRFVSGEKLTVARILFKKGAPVSIHEHESEQISYVLEGTLRFQVAGDEVTLSKGQVLLIPSSVPHGAEALEDSVVLDIFSPIRQDWLDKDDAYLRR
jgi:quercetin dioxygenase-like cupin family protein